MTTDICPLCQSDLTGAPIPQEYLDRGYYSAGSTHYSRLMGHEIPGVYDGILYWSCPDCRRAWPRWTEGARGAKAQSYVDAHNRSLQ